MTRETKIGLLVGLAFIIVIGILLSDYNRIENPQAQLFVAGPNERKSVATLVTDPPVQQTIVYPKNQPGPRQQVPTRDELSQRNDGNAEVVIRPTGGQTRVNPNDQTGGVVVIHNANGSNPPPNRNITPPNVNNNLLRTHPEEIVAVSPNSGQDRNSGQQVTAAKSYTAVAGDTVSKMAGRFMGGNTKTNRDAIVKANPTLQANINNVISGREYLIPAVAASTPAVQPTAVAQKTKPAVEAPVNQPPQVPTHWYVVKENDSLWRIAQDQLGDPNAIAAIKELNKDQLKGRDEIHPNMKLRLPAKPLASVN